MIMYVRVENGVPCGSPQTFEEVPSGWVEFVKHTGDIDYLIQTVVQTYDADSNRVVESLMNLASPTDLILASVRVTRDQMLTSTDWTQLPDVVFNAGVKAAWATYRTDLRNVPSANSSVTSIDDVVWPTKPS
mgnify:CR=1 FL=1